MSGRAGRRGKDDRGLVILMVDQQMGQDVAKQIIKGSFFFIHLLLNTCPCCSFL
ncbi:unnamed protein product [Gongylonema pulchrum]|uniref:Helicase C-terminal domain-containing protein n=1 Tax=Gongylonema pulchrum TaxID=637853 RepID=A0A183EW29_9BILA|nr:unnamed protein product [Gongylonema pulchrum]